MAARTRRTGTKKMETAVKTEPVKVKTEPVKEVSKPVEKPAEKEVAKKVAVRKTVAKKELKVKTVVEYFGKQVEEKEMIAAVKKAWTRKGRKVADIKTIDLYIKPEEGAIYYVINDTDAGAVSF